MSAAAPLRAARPAGSLEAWFAPFRAQVIGHDLHDPRVQGAGRVVYADWTASGRLYRPIEDYIADVLGPYVANTHTETTLTGTRMTHAYHQAQAIIKRHCNAGPKDVLIAQGSGMTGVVNKFQRILGLRVPEHKALQELLAVFGQPLIATTLIPPGETEPLNDAQDIRERLQKQVQAVLDAGACPMAPTTVVDLSGDAPEVLRHGRGDAARLGL